MTVDVAIFAGGFKREPYWHDLAPLEESTVALPSTPVDAAVIGSGLTGLSAALTLARAGRSVLVLEAGRLGEGASTRNSGVLGRNLKTGLATLIEKVGEEKALGFYKEASRAFDDLLRFIEEERIDAGIVRRGRLVCAIDDTQREAIAKELTLKEQLLGEGFALLTKAEVQSRLASDSYVSGAIIPGHISFHAGLLYRGVLDVVRKAGVLLVSSTPMLGIEEGSDRFRLRTPRGILEAREVIVATNGYTGHALPWLRRRVVPIHGFMIATETLPEGLAAKILPGAAAFHDYSVNTEYGRPTHDGTRFIFGGETGSSPADLDRIACRLHERMVRVLPDLRGARVAHVWTGTCAAPFDYLPHLGRHGRLRYAMGYCFSSGVPQGWLLGRKAALDILGAGGAGSAFDETPLPSRPFYWGHDWFTPLVFGWHRMREGRR